MEATLNPKSLQVIWPFPPPLRNKEEWRECVNIVELLCEIGDIVEWLNGVSGKDIYTRMPFRYQIDSVEVEFLPHWGYYSVGNIHFDVRKTEGEIRKDIAAVKALQGRRPTNLK